MRLVIQPTSAVTKLVRADSNGTRSVRVFNGTWPSSATEELVVIDYEPSLVGAVEYRLSTATENLSEWTTMEDGTNYLPRFNLPAIPFYSAEVKTVYTYDAARASRATVHAILGRNDPIIIQGRLETRRGSMSCVFESHAEAIAFIQILERGQAVFYRQAEHAGLDMYFVASDVQTAPQDNLWTVIVSFIEVDSPRTGLAAAGNWTFEKLAKTGNSFDQVAMDYRSFTELTLGEKGV